jgi:hypothetical protein
MKWAHQYLIAKLTQSDTVIHSKIQIDIHEQEEQLNKRVSKKPMVRQTLHQPLLTPEKIAFNAI